MLASHNVNSLISGGIMQKMGIFQRSTTISYFHYNFYIYTGSFSHAGAQSEASPPVQFIQLILPLENRVTIDKKPSIKVKFNRAVYVEELFVMLDGVDITGVLDLSQKGFEYHPIHVLAAGAQTLIISGTTAVGESYNREFAFSTRHYQAVEKGYSQSDRPLLFNPKSVAIL